MKKERQGRQGKTPEGTGTGENSTTPPPPAREVKGKDKGETNEGEIGSQRNRTVTNHHPGEGRRKERKKKEGRRQGGSRPEQNRPEQRQERGHNERI